MADIRKSVPLAMALTSLALLGSASETWADQKPEVEAPPSSHSSQCGAGGVVGRVSVESGSRGPVGVYAYSLADRSLHQAATDPQGNFIFQGLPAGLYKIIANRPGFLPAVILLTRSTAQACQFLDLQLSHPASSGEAARAAQAAALVKSAAVAGAAHSPAQALPLSPSQLVDPVQPAADIDFWTLRASLPSDVLRDTQAPGVPETMGSGAGGIGGLGAIGAGGIGSSGAVPGAGTALAAPEVPAAPAGIGGLPAELSAGGAGQFRFQGFSPATAGVLSSFHTEMQAMTGVGQVSQLGIGQLADGRLGIEGNVGDVRVGLKGRFWQATSSGLPLRGAADGQASAVTLDLQAGAGSKISLTSLNNRLVPAHDGTSQLPVGFEDYGVTWSQDIGDSSRSDFVARYTSESNYHHQGPADPQDIAGASRTWRIEGSYTTALGDAGNLQSGFRFREYQPGALAGSAAVLPGGVQDTVDFFTRGGLRLQPALLIEYGLYNTLRDGSVALTPQGGIVVQLGSGWQVRTLVSQRAYQTTAVTPEFLPALFRDTDMCEQGGRSCYRLELNQHQSDENSISLTASQRVVGETLRLYFSDELSDYLQSIYLVPGDRVPEAHLSVKRRLSRGVVTTLDSSLGVGGGGIFTAADGQPYENRVRYLVTSLDTRFQGSATGVFLALHRVNQELAPLAGATTGSMVGQFERLQLMLTQDMSMLLNLGNQWSRWSLQLEMDLSRGESAPTSLASSDRALNRRFMGGISVRF